MDFDEYEADFLSSVRSATTLIGKSNYSDSSVESRAALSQASAAVQAARSGYKQMKLAANSNAARRVQLRPKLSQYKKTLDGLETDLQRAERSGLFGVEGGRKSGSSGFSAASQIDRDRMLNNTSRLQKQRQTLENSNNTLNETNEVALGVMDELARNRQTIQSARGKAKRMMGGTDRARWLVSDMAKRNATTKVMACLVFTFVCGMIGYLLYLALGGGQNSDGAGGGGSAVVVGPSPSALRLR